MNRIRVWIWRNQKACKNWLSWFGITALSLLVASYFMFIPGVSKTFFMPGSSIDGHYQIEEQCNLCHKPFGGVKQKACTSCHGEDLKSVNDSHSLKKFRDPRNTLHLDKMNVKKCRICHKEHDLKNTEKMGVTVANDFCIYCHEDIAKERSTHKGLKFDGCTACHKYHDNTNLYEDFLTKHLDEKPTKKKAIIPSRNFGQYYREKNPNKIISLNNKNNDAPSNIRYSKQTISDWESSKHAKSGVNCSKCHKNSLSKIPWQEKPAIKHCAECHKTEVKGFTESRHGMRLSQKLPTTMSPMKPGMARLPMAKDVANNSVDCNSCHKAHKDNTYFAGVEACLNCHIDKHSLNYKKSKHYQLFLDEKLKKSQKGTGVSCATCHLPREMDGNKLITVQHNQNANLRPNQKQIRTVCMKCHGLGFSLDSLADDNLVKNNFKSRPKVHLKSLDMVKARNEQLIKDKKTKNGDVK